MAQLNPSQFPNLREDGGLFRELDVLERLRIGLPSGYDIFHEVTWHNVHEGIDRHGEIDIVVLSPTGSMLLMEVKAGQVVLRAGELFKIYGQQEHDVLRQYRVQYAGMVTRLKQAELHPYLVNCLVLPDYNLPLGQVVSIPRERIITADEYDQLSTHVKNLLNVDNGSTDREAIRGFLCNEFKVVPSITTLRDQLHGATQRLSDGMAVWVPRITHSSGVLRIQATAGSGKTQLALTLLEGAIAAKESALYVCYNRPLADMITSIAPTRSTVASYHELAVDHYRSQHQEPNFGDPEVFKQIDEAYQQDSNQFVPKYDLLIIDEAQDFDPQWVASLLCLLKPTGRLYLMEDEAQRLYEREAFDLPDAVTLTCNDNHRSPRAICQVINALALVQPAIISQSPYQGNLPEFRSYTSDRILLEQTEQAVLSLMAQGFELSDIVILTGHGRNKSKLLNAEHIGRFTTRRFTGAYSREGNPVWSKGDLTIESIYRFKGQSAPAIILSEVDFTELTEQERRKLFVGMTRAQLNLQVIMSPQAEKCFVKLLG
jgi:thymidine kinase